MPTLNKIEDSLIAAIKSPDLQNIGIDLTEIAIDSIFENGLLKEIPIISSLIGIGKTSITIRDALFAKKIIYFLTKLSEVPSEKRAEMVNYIDNDNKQRVKVGERLIYILDKCDDHITSKYIGQLFSAFLNERINYNEFLKGARIIQDIFLGDLEYFIEHEYDYFKGEGAMSPDGPMEYIPPLINAEICSFLIKSIKVEDQWDHEDSDRYIVDGGELEIYITDIGYKLKEILKLEK